MEKVEVQLGSKALQRLASTLYSMDWTAIWVREIGLQNAIDACKNTGRPAQVKIELVEESGTSTLTVTDNGCGMDENIFKNSFMTIGESGKKDGVGGFGVASAVALSADFCEVLTQDLAWSSTDMMLHKSSWIEGTIVTCRKATSLSIPRILNMVYLSDVDVHLVIVVDGETLIDDPHAGAKWSKVVKTEYKGSQWTCSVVHSNLPDKAWDIEGANIYRLNGLVQYVTYNKSSRKIALRFDITPTSRPGDSDYPMTLSRESLNGETQDEIRRTVERFNVDSISAVKPKPVNPVQSREIAGHGYRSRRLKDTVSIVANLTHEQLTEFVNAVRAMSPNEYISRSDALASASSMSAEEIIKLAKAHEDKPAMYFDQFDPKTLSPGEFQRHAKLLEAWKEVVLMAADPNETFSIGITGDDSVMASHRSGSPLNYYLLNTKKFLAVGIRSKEGRVLALWHLACHEASHFRHELHNEEFASEEGYISRESAEMLADELKRIAKIF